MNRAKINRRRRIEVRRLARARRGQSTRLLPTIREELYEGHEVQEPIQEPSPLLSLIMGYLAHLGFTDLALQPIPEEFQYWVEAHNYWLKGMQQIGVSAALPSDGPEQGMESLPTPVWGRRVWDPFHHFVYEYLRKQGKQGLDFKYRALDGTKPVYYPVQDLLQHIVYQDPNASSSG